MFLRIRLHPKTSNSLRPRHRKPAIRLECRCDQRCCSNALSLPFINMRGGSWFAPSSESSQFTLSVQCRRKPRWCRTLSNCVFIQDAVGWQGLKDVGFYFIFQPPPATPAQREEDQMQVVAASRHYSFFIRHGQIPQPSDPEFNAFYQRYLLQWGSIVSILFVVQKHLTDFAIPIAHVNGDK